MGMRDFGGELAALRAGSLSFDDVQRVLTPLLTARAVWFLRRWRQTLLTEHDLVQEMLLAVWRAVDTFDQERTRHDLVWWVDRAVGRAAELELARAAGWPDKRRTPVLRQVGVEDVTVLIGGYDVATDDDIDRRRRVTRLAARLAPEDRQVFGVLVSRGFGAAKIADELYRDPRVRLERCWDSTQHARREVRESVKRIQALVMGDETTKEGAVQA